MDRLFKDHPEISAYIDDIVVHSTTSEEHLKALDTALTILEQANLTAKKGKSQLPRNSLQFLGFTLGGGTINTQQAKVAAFVQFLKPRTKTELRSFLGLVGFYRKFVPGFATIAAPLHSLTGHSVPKELAWNQQADEAFLTLKKMIIPVKVDHPFILQTDASDVGLGAALAQEHDGEEHPVAFFLEN